MEPPENALRCLKCDTDKVEADFAPSIWKRFLAGRSSPGWCRNCMRLNNNSSKRMLRVAKSVTSGLRATLAKIQIRKDEIYAERMALEKMESDITILVEQYSKYERAENGTPPPF